MRINDSRNGTGYAGFGRTPQTAGFPNTAKTTSHGKTINQIKTIYESQEKKSHKASYKEKVHPPLETPSEAEEKITEETAAEDNVSISGEAAEKSRAEKSQKEDPSLYYSRLSEELERAVKAGEGMAAMMKEKIKCMQIAMRIMSGDKVPPEDHRYLADKDIELYSRAMSMKIQKVDPDEYDRLSEDEEEEPGSEESGRSRLSDAAAVEDCAPAEAADAAAGTAAVEAPSSDG